MKIGELAKRCGCSVETVRFYEKKGLLKKTGRSVNGYRQYAETHAAQLNFIRHCRSLDMRLPDVSALLNVQAHPELACDVISNLIDSHIDNVRLKIQSLQELERQLHLLRDTCQAVTSVSECAIMRHLEQAAEDATCPCHSLTERGRESTESTV